MTSLHFRSTPAIGLAGETRRRSRVALCPALSIPFLAATPIAGERAFNKTSYIWTKEVTGFDPASQPNELAPYCPVRNVTSQYPPTLLILGTEDNDVPYSRSVGMAAALAREKVPHKLIAVHGAGHGLSGCDPQAVEEAHVRALEFIQRYLK